MISVSKVPYERIRIFLNPQLFLSGFKNVHVHTYPVNSTYESVTFLICSGSPEWKFLNTLWIRNRVDAKSAYLTLIGRRWAKYRDLSVASISIGWGKKIYLLDADKSRYFAITDIGLITVLSFDDRILFLFFNYSPKNLPFSRKSDGKKEKSVDSFTHEQNIICSQTQLDDIAHEQIINYFWAVICRSRGGLSSNEKEEKFASNDNLFYPVT